jgi:predicted nucleic acid-binding protein
MVDILRGYSPAVDGLDKIVGEAPALPGLVVLELMDGCRNRMEMRRLLTRLAPFHVYWPTDGDCNRALSAFAKYSLSHKLSVMDALIAECTLGLNATLCTFNIKHFKPIANLQTHRPYSRS